jgi:hypothetical protein
MINPVRDYILLQRKLVQAIKEHCPNLWEFTGSELIGWRCEPHGEHICCTNLESEVQVELPLLSESGTGVDTGHFAYYLKTIGVEPPSYAEIHDAMAMLEADGLLQQVQTSVPPLIWSIAEV